MDNNHDFALARLLDDEHDPADAAAVAARMQAQGEFSLQVAELFRLDGLVHAAMHDDETFCDAVTTLIDAEDTGSRFVSAVESRIAPRHRPRPPAAMLLSWLITVAACITAAWLTIRPTPPQPTQRMLSALPPAPPVPPAADLAALIVNSLDAEFAPAAGPAGFRARPGPYSLLRGIVHLRFVNGVDFVITGPAEFAIIDQLHVEMSRGTARALVPMEGHGFTVSTPEAEYEDVGTEFGVQLNGNASGNRLHVFAGQVNVRLPATAIQAVLEGRSVQVANGRMTDAPPANPEDYPTPAELNYLRWLKSRSSMTKQPGIVAYFPFTSDSAGQLVNEVLSGPVGNGRIAGAHSVSGRWPGKQGLLFDQDGDRVELTVADSQPAITLSLWLNPSRVDFAHTSLISSNGADPGGIHWKIDRNSRTSLAICTDNGWQATVGPVIPSGQWSNLIVTIDLPNHRITHFINGSRFAELTTTATVCRPGQCRVGDWVPEQDHPLVTRARGFRGRIDELAIWQRVLTAEEIAGLWETGRPSFLPTP